jgi:L-phenylalanine/L-methionine N-acetyltransferase
VALVKGEVVGSAGLHPASPALRRRHAWMLGISVAADWHNRGVGTALMAALLDYADNWVGALRVELTVFADNEAAQALYGKFGFETEGRLRAYALRNGVYCDVLTMARLRALPPVER